MDVEDDDKQVDEADTGGGGLGGLLDGSNDEGEEKMGGRRAAAGTGIHGKEKTTRVGPAGLTPAQTVEARLHKEVGEAEMWIELRQRLAVRKELKIEEQLRGQRRMVIKYTTDGSVTFFKCTLQVTPNATFQTVLDEVCAHWGLPADQAFLEYMEDGGIWPSCAKIEDSIDIKMITPVMQLVFRLGCMVQQLVSANDNTIDLANNNDKIWKYKEAKHKMAMDGHDEQQEENMLAVEAQIY